MRQSNPMPVVYHGLQPSRVDDALMSASHVYLRVDAVRRPLVPPYEGPYPVLERSSKTFVILKREKPITVTVDRLKPAVLLPEVPSASPPSGRSPASEPSPAASTPSSAQFWVRLLPSWILLLPSWILLLRLWTRLPGLFRRATDDVPVLLPVSTCDLAGFFWTFLVPCGSFRRLFLFYRVFAWPSALFLLSMNPSADQFQSFKVTCDIYYN